MDIHTENHEKAVLLIQSLTEHQLELLIKFASQAIREELTDRFMRDAGVIEASDNEIEEVQNRINYEYPMWT